VGRSPYQSEKRRKELARLKKQEEKRQRRFNKKHEGEKGPDQPEGSVVEGESQTDPVMEDGAAAPPRDEPDSQPPSGETGQTS
jgi:hypothetical protein